MEENNKKPLSDGEAEQLMTTKEAAICQSMNVSPREIVERRLYNALHRHDGKAVHSSGEDAPDDGTPMPFARCEQCKEIHVKDEHRGALSACAFCHDAHDQSHQSEDSDDDEGEMSAEQRSVNSLLGISDKEFGARRRG